MIQIVCCILDVIILALSILSILSTPEIGDPKFDTIWLTVDSIALVITLIVLLKWIIILIRKKRNNIKDD